MASNLTTAERLYQNSNSYGSIHPQRYKYSFSGADARMLVFFPQRPDLISYLDSVHTLSISVHEAKSQVRSIGYRGIKGLTRSVRTVAGSMILTVVNDHPLRPLIDQYNKMLLDMNDGETFYNPLPFGWSVDRDELGVGTHQDVYSFQNRLAALLPPFNLIMEFVAEMAPATIDRSQEPTYGLMPRDENGRRVLSGSRTLFPGAGLMLQDIEFVDEGFVVSVNDMVTEITLSYIARDFKPISANTFHDGGQALTQTDIRNREWELWKKLYGDSRNKTETVLNIGSEQSRAWEDDSSSGGF